MHLKIKTQQKYEFKAFLILFYRADIKNCEFNKP